MTDTQFLVLAGVAYVAPHIQKEVALFLGCAFLIGSAVKGLFL